MKDALRALGRKADPLGLTAHEIAAAALWVTRRRHPADAALWRLAHDLFWSPHRPTAIRPAALLERWRAQRGRCALTGVRFNFLVEARVVGDQLLHVGLSAAGRRPRVGPLRRAQLTSGPHLTEVEREERISQLALPTALAAALKQAAARHPLARRPLLRSFFPQRAAPRRLFANGTVLLAELFLPTDGGNERQVVRCRLIGDELVVDSGHGLVSRRFALAEPAALVGPVLDAMAAMADDRLAAAVMEASHEATMFRLSAIRQALRQLAPSAQLMAWADKHLHDGEQPMAMSSA